jgi:hypothetical protein
VAVTVPTMWNVVLLRRHLTRPALTGEVWWGPGRKASGKYGTTRIPGVPAVLEPERFAALVKAVSVHGPRTGAEIAYPLAGRIKSRCGRHFNGVYRASRELRSYKCAGKRGEHREPACPCVWLDADPLDDRVWEAVCELLADPERVRETVREYLAIEAGQTAVAADDLTELKSEIANLETQLSTGVANYLRAGVDPETMAQATASLSNELAAKRSRRDDIERYRADARTQANALDEIALVVARGADRLETMSDAQRAEVLRLLDVTVELLDDTRTPELLIRGRLVALSPGLPPDRHSWMASDGETPPGHLPFALSVAG